jgi:hypothetical protein
MKRSDFTRFVNSLDDAKVRAFASQKGIAGWRNCDVNELRVKIIENFNK